MKGFYTIRQVCQCCEVSRATMLRMENRGLLLPAFVDHNTGYRYYNAANISRVLHIRMFLSMGLTYDDAALYFRSGGQSRELLRSLRERLSALQRAYDAMGVRIDGALDRKTELLRLPDYVCYQKEFPASPPDAHGQALCETLREAVERGCRPLIAEHLFLVYQQPLLSRDEAGDGPDAKGAPEGGFVCCVPVQQSPGDGLTVTYPGCTAFSLLCRGGAGALGQAYRELARRVRRLGLKPTGCPRSIAIVNGYTGEDIRQEDYVTRLAVPIEEPSREARERLEEEL